MPEVIVWLAFTTENALLYTGAANSFIVDRNLNTIRVQDGMTAGGNILLSGNSNLGDLPDVAQACKNLGLGTAAFLDADTGFMVGINDLSEVVNAAAARVNIGAAQSNINDDLRVVHLQTDGLRYHTNDGFVYTWNILPTNPGADAILNLQMPIDGSVVRLDGVNTGDQIITATGDVTGVMSDVSTFPLAIGPKKVLTGMINDAAVTTQQIADATVTAQKLANLGVAGTYNLASIQLNDQGLVIAAVDGAFGGLETHRATSVWLGIVNGVTFNHALGVIPDLTQTYFKCISNDAGYVVDDIIHWSHFIGGVATNNGTTLKVDVANVTMYLENTPLVVDSTGVGHSITLAKWNVQFNVISFSA